MEKTNARENIYRIANIYCGPEGGTFVLNTDEFQLPLDEGKHIITDVWMDVIPEGNEKIEGFTVYMYFLMDGFYAPACITYKVDSAVKYTVDKNIHNILDAELCTFTDYGKELIQTWFGVETTEMTYLDPPPVDIFHLKYGDAKEVSDK